MLLNYANPCRNWTFKRFARVAEKKERNGTNEKSDIRLDLNPGPRLVACRLVTMYIYSYIYYIYYVHIDLRSILVMWLKCRLLDTEVDCSNPGISMLCH